MDGESAAASTVAFLREHVGDVITLEFDDGEVIDAKLLHLDADDHNDITYDVVRVRTSASERQYDSTAAYLMPISAIRRATIRER
jgi:hypothetical protein